MSVWMNDARVWRDAQIAAGERENERRRQIVAASDTAGRMDSADHIAAPGMWSYACPCLRCRWEQWWNEGDNSAIPMPEEPHPDGDYARYFSERDKWSGRVHPNEQ